MKEAQRYRSGLRLRKFFLEIQVHQRFGGNPFPSSTVLQPLYKSSRYRAVKELSFDLHSNLRDFLHVGKVEQTVLIPKFTRL